MTVTKRLSLFVWFGREKTVKMKETVDILRLVDRKCRVYVIIPSSWVRAVEIKSSAQVPQVSGQLS